LDKRQLHSRKRFGTTSLQSSKKSHAGGQRHLVYTRLKCSFPGHRRRAWRT
jgi:hypothetical protein